MSQNGAAPRTALVTGGGRGIGRAVAEGLAMDGLNIVIADLRREESDVVAAAIAERGGQALAVASAVARADAVRAAGEAAGERFGQVDVLVNNAGWDDLKPFLATDEAFWDRII